MFSHTEYKNIINLISQYLPIVDYKDIIKKGLSEFCVIRHDVEFSLDRALKLAEIEKQLGVISTYTVQLRNNTYNALSEKNVNLVHEIKSLGHKIGLHQNPPLMPERELKLYVLKDIQTLEYYYGFKIDRYAFHRPKQEQLKMYLDIPGLINCYDKKFFQYFEVEKPGELSVTYLADSNHKWKYGYPMELDFNIVKKLQLNTHPFSWTEQGYEKYGNFLSLIEERKKEMLYDMDSENKAFPKELLL